MSSYRPPTALGILYAEDFGRDRNPPPPRPAPAPPPPAAPRGPTQADVDAACIRAVQAAQTAWSESAAERRAEALAALAAALSDAREQDAQQAEALANGIARTVLSMLVGTLPHLCRGHGDNEVRAIMRRLAPVLARDTRLVVRVHPGLIDTLADDIATIDDSLALNIELRPANLPPGDIRIAWEDGSLARDTGAICAAMRDTLAQLGLDADPSENLVHPSRSLAHVQ